MADPTDPRDASGNRIGPRRTVQPSDPARVLAALKGDPGMPAAASPTPVGSSAPTLRDAVNQAVQTTAPRSIVNRRTSVNDAVNRALGEQF